MRRNLRGERVKLPRVNRVRRGARLYKYHRITGVALPSDVPEDDPAFIAAWTAEEGKRAPVKPRAAPGTIGAAWIALRGAGRLAGYSPTYRSLLIRNGEAIVTAYGEAPISGLMPHHVRADLTKLPPHPANARLKTWRLLCGFAHDVGMTKQVATDGIHKPQAPKAVKHAPWGGDEVAAFRASWPIGTVQRLCFELLYWTGARTNDAVRLSRSMIGADGLLVFRQSKTGHEALVPWTSNLPAWAAHMESDRDMLHQCLAGCRGFTFLEARGRVRSCKGLSNLISHAADKAGISGKTAHGLRATRLTLVAEAGGSAHAIMTWGGHKTLSEAEGYTREADRRKVLVGTERTRNPVNRPVNQK